MTKKALVTGITGQDGSYLSEFLLDQGYAVYGMVRRSSEGSYERIKHLLDALKDTTASVYFVPDMFVTDLIQGRTDSVCGLPVISVCETPFTGPNAVLKRASDIVLSVAILLLLSPLMLGIAAAIKLTSPGPVIFRQRRYGLWGQEIIVYKFRSMTVTEDGPVVTQARKDDNRVTPLGRILRRRRRCGCISTSSATNAMT